LTVICDVLNYGQRDRRAKLRGLIPPDVDRIEEAISERKAVLQTQRG
jgi:hypothetical protein